jgi:glycosyltransferase involved in cell wall biosynthesis
MNTTHFVSIIIPVRNAERTIRPCVVSILKLQYPRFELIVIDDGSSDKTLSILKEFSSDERLKVLSGQHGGPSRARNLGIQQSRGEYIAFTDGDCVVPENWLQELVDAMGGDGNIAGVGGAQLSPDDDTSFGKSIYTFMKAVGFLTGYMKAKPGTNTIVETDHNPSCNALYKKEVLDEVGGFSEGLWPGEDVDLDYRITKSGYRLLMAPQAVVYHYRPSTLSRFMKMMYNYGLVQTFLIRKYGFFRTVHYFPFVSVMMLMALASLLVWSFSIFVAVIVTMVITAFLFFFLKIRKLQLSAFSVFLLSAALLSWHRGFASGLFKKQPIK